MSFLRNPGRRAGLIYILVSIPGFFALLWIPSQLIVHGDATATSQNIAAHETLFRTDIATDLIGQILFIFAPLALYGLLKEVNRRDAIAMLALIVIALPIVMLNEAFGMGVLVALHPGNFMSAFDQPQRNAIAMLLLNLRSGGFTVAGIFWALWLLPLARLIYRSGFIPKIFGILLPIAASSYLVASFTALLAPQFAGFTDKWIQPLQGLELLFPIWLLIMGAKPKTSPGRTPAMAMAS